MGNAESNKDRTEDDRLPFRLRIKKCRMLLAYYFKNFRRHLNFAYILFGLNLFLFSLILIPNLAHRSPIPLGSWPMVLEIRGTVFAEVKSTEGNISLLPLGLVRVEIGGYQAMTDRNGQFQISFTAQTHTNIPIVFRWVNRVTLRHISFEQGQFKKDEAFVIE